MNCNTDIACSTDEIQRGSSPQRNEIVTMEEENPTDTNDDFVMISDDISSKSESVPSLNGQPNAMGSEDTIEGARKTLAAEAPSPVNRNVIYVHYRDNQFKIFCRTEIISKLISVYDSSEIKYVQLFQHLLHFENELYKKDTICYNSELFIAFFNKWLLTKKRPLNQKDATEEQGHTLTDHPKSTNKQSSKDFDKNQKYNMKLDILHKVLLNVCHERQYLKLIKKLYDVERCDLIALEEYVFLNDIL